MEKRNILILGMGISGKSIYEALNKQKFNVFVYDDNLDNINESMQIVDEDLSGIELIIKSPGIKPNHPILVKAERKNIEIITDIELFYRLRNKGEDIVAITGTNGKTTTTALVAEIIKKEYKAAAVGNIGVGVLDVLDTDLDFIVMECSSFQLNNIVTFKPHISVITNITPDHLEWHGNYENYKNAKLNIFKNQTKDDITILNYNDGELKDISLNSNVFYFSENDHKTKGTFVENNSIWFRNEKAEEVYDLSGLKLLGSHNLENVLAAVCVAKLIGIQNTNIKEILDNFSGVEHRLEFVKNIDGVSYYNDSKGTNPASTIKAVESFDNNLILIAGGYQKNADYTEMLETAKPKLKNLILFGETKFDIQNASQKLNIDSIIVNDLEEAIKKAYGIASKGDNVLLSPACASWDMYKSYEERGRHFKKLVIDLDEKI